MHQPSRKTETNCSVLLAVQLATKRVHMFNAVKVLMAFSKPFWPDDFFDAVCTGDSHEIAEVQSAHDATIV